MFIHDCHSGYIGRASAQLHYTKLNKTVLIVSSLDIIFMGTERWVMCITVASYWAC